MGMMAYSFKVKNERKMMMNNAKLKNDLDGVGFGSNYAPLLILQLPDSRTLHVMSRSLFVVLFLFSLPSIGAMMSGSSHINDESNVGCLVEGGILKKGERGLLVASSGNDAYNFVKKDFDVLNQNDIDFGFLVESSVMNGENVNIPNEALDFVFVQNLKNVMAIDRLLKLGGVIISQIKNNQPFQLQPPANFVIVVSLGPLDHTTVVLRKISHSSSINGLEEKMSLPGRRPLCGMTPRAKKTALLGLEDALLEPPSEKMKKSNKLSRKMKFLPDLLKESLQNYPRRIFFSDGDKGVSQWFNKNYPTRGQKFEMFDMEVVANEAGNGKSSRPSRVGMLSDWLRNHVEEQDYVVMKAEATLVEEMIKENTTCFVDELFLECKSQYGEDDEENGEEKDSSKRSYWQCLELYGRLRDEGVAVHQWWS